MNDVIYKGPTGQILVTTLVLTDKAGNGECTVKSNPGFAWLARGARFGYQAFTISSIITLSDSGKTISNDGAGATVEITLPTTPGAGIHFNFVRVASQALRINPPAGAQIIYSGGVMSDGEYLELASNGAKLSLISDGSNNWIATDESGTLTEETP